MAGQDTATSSLKVASSVAPYIVEFPKHQSQELSSAGFLLIDNSVRAEIQSAHVTQLSIVASEEIKCLSTVEQVCDEMANANFSKDSVFFAVGGGVVQDIATMVASIFKRGVKWVYVPTTLAAMVDSCVGGKSSINLGERKNVLGNFHPPSRILVSTRFLSTLPTNEMLCGLAEAVKINFARGPEAFSMFLDNPASVEPGDNEETIRLISDTLSSKIWFIERDEFDLGERQLLNYGHTFGHAIESATGFRIPHGIAVALGMLAANRFSEKGLFPGRERLETYLIWLLNSVENLGEMLEAISWEAFDIAILSDKKASVDSVSFILPGTSGQLSKVSLPKSQQTLELAAASFKSVLREILD